ncbi:MAG: TonB-dependent receptor [Rhodospirillaceae bacterium]|nr:TonB-dependent receptor [Rhodospirillaceae bacterium]MDD9996613.1 TonB-dependent receptor [Rhodospirillaceae bacterium]
MACLLGAVLMMGTAWGQEGDELEEIVVTGSYLYTGVDSPSPVSVIDGEDIRLEAPQDLMQYFVTSVPQNYSGDTGQQTGTNGQPRVRGGGRSAQINLRGIGDENTLTVINGRRSINSVIDGQGWPSPDLNAMVPRIAIGRTEILLDGGSALFGSDPVAGVVNFITRDDFRGFDFSFDTRINEAVTDANNYTFGAIWGAGNETSSGVFSIEFTETDRIGIGDIEFADDPNPDVTPETGTGLSTIQGGAFDYVPAMGMGLSWVDPDCGNPELGPPLEAKYPAAISDFTREVSSTTDATVCAQPSGYTPGNVIQHDKKLLTLYASAEHNFSDELRAGVELNYGRERIAETDLWGDNIARTWAVPPGRLGTEFAIPTHNPGYMRAQSRVPSFGTFRGMGVPTYMEAETLPYGQEFDAFTRSDHLRAVFSLDGQLTGSWEWNFDVQTAYFQAYQGVRDMLVANLPLALNGYGGSDCGVDDPFNTDVMPGTGFCHYYNPFMSAGLPNAEALGLANDREMVEWLSPNRLDVFQNTFTSADFLVTGEVGELAGGPIGLAAGVATRRESMERDSDVLANQGQLASVGTFNDWSGKQSVNSVFAEAALPLTDSVNVQLAVRNEEYHNGLSQTTPKVAVNWTATDDLTVRASYGTSFRGPSIVHASASQIIQGMGMGNAVVGGMSYGAMGGISFIYEIAADPDVKPQTADNLSIGFDYDVTDNHSVGATWVAFDFQDRIVTPTAPTVMSGTACLNTDANGIPIVSGGRITYVPIDEGGCAVARDPTAPLNIENVARIVGNVDNLGYLDAEFLDVRASLNFDTAWGALRFAPQASFTLKYEFPNALGGAGVEVLCPEFVCDAIGRDINATVGMGGGFNGVTSMPHWQGNFPLFLTIRGDHTLRLNANYRDSLNAQFEDLSEENRSVFNHENGQWIVSANYIHRFGNGASLNFAVQNLFATDPPDTQGARFFRRLREYGIQYRQSFDP